MTEGILIIYVSPNGRDEWKPVLPADVPAWLKDRHVMGELVGGDIACKADEDPPLWYRAERVDAANDNAPDLGGDAA